MVANSTDREMVVCYAPGDVPMMEDPDNPGFMIPDDTWLITEDEEPVDSPETEKESRLLTEPIYSNWPGPGGRKNFMVMADIGLFFSPTESPLVPDAMLVVNPLKPAPTEGTFVRSYFVWRYGKDPDVLIEIVSNRKGGEATHKLKKCAEISVPWYVIYDPKQISSREVLRVFGLMDGTYQPHPTGYFPDIGLGLRLWRGNFEDWADEVFLRWCDQDGEVIPTGTEVADRVKVVAQRESRRAEAQSRLAEEQSRKAEEQTRIAEEQTRRAELLAAKFRAAGTDPDDIAR